MKRCSASLAIREMQVSFNLKQYIDIFFFLNLEKYLRNRQKKLWMINFEEIQFLETGFNEIQN